MTGPYFLTRHFLTQKKFPKNQTFVLKKCRVKNHNGMETLDILFCEKNICCTIFLEIFTKPDIEIYGKTFWNRTKLEQLVLFF